jgi:hypothetical protein
MSLLSRLVVYGNISLLRFFSLFPSTFILPKMYFTKSGFKKKLGAMPALDLDQKIIRNPRGYTLSTSD